MMFIFQHEDPVSFRFTVEDIRTRLHFWTDNAPFLIKEALELMLEIISSVLVTS